ncbi:Calnexin homolog Flags: Precursor [Serendipita indica DSM 11827]|uniref:Calnexin n=1 Tax=Serendipita indica (strain DSM 11827) TaxID=1109443 RepID=G4TC79_SERID|nr:Calnexin homolog Flags: Precursor [Serendipita indica DSM 11827]CCA68922.1 probable calcium-binding protein precursor cnx1 [Serendipita indica DSM 11827]
MRTYIIPLAVLVAAGASAHEGHDHDHAQVVEEAPKPSESLTHSFTPTKIKAPFLEQFTDDWAERWTPSEATKKTPVGGETFSYVGKWSVEEASVYPVIAGDKGLVAKSKAAHHAISAPFAKPIDFSDKSLVVQYEVKYQKGGNCGGGYIKLLEDGFQTSGKEFSDKTPWVIMFGPDLTCPGAKLHFIFRHKNPITGEYEEKHQKPATVPAIGKTTKLYTLIINPDQTFVEKVDGKEVSSGSLLNDFEPPVNPPKEIDDPNDKKPEDWVDEAKIQDPEAKKPEDWDEDAPYQIPDEDAVKPEDWLDDEPDMIPDPDAIKPEEWDDEEDGDWVAPLVKNPKCEQASGCGPWKRPNKANPAYKGKWYAPMIDNPAYKGEWAPRKIANPDYFEDLYPVQSLNKIGGVGIELWTMTEDILFDNIYIGHSMEDAAALAEETFYIKEDAELRKEANRKPAGADDDDDEETADRTFKEAPVAFIRKAVLSFIELAKIDPVMAVKTKPETATALAVGIVTLFGMLGTFLGLLGASQAPVTKSPKKSEKKEEASSSAAATNGTEKTAASAPAVAPVDEQLKSTPASTSASTSSTKKRR